MTEDELKASMTSRTRSLTARDHEDLQKVSMIAKRETKDPIKISFRDVNYRVRVKTTP